MTTGKNSLKLAIIQSDLFWEDIDANLNFFNNKIKAIREHIDLVLLPETFSTGFTMNVEKFADDGNKSLDWMIQLAHEKSVSIAGSLIVKEGNKFFNRMYFVDHQGKVDHYDKRHLFRMGREQEYFTRGEKRVIVKSGNFRILLQICYDLRFPVFARNRGDYDLIIYAANWPAPRQTVWDSLLVARAIENQAFVIGANRSGIDGEGVACCGNSCVIDPKGNVKARLDDQPGLIITSIDLEEVSVFRKNFPVHEDADDFEIK